MKSSRNIKTMNVVSRNVHVFDKIFTQINPIKIFAGQCTPSNQFKGNNLNYLDLIQRLFDPNPKTRIDLSCVKKHPWYLGEAPSKHEYKK